MARLRNISLWRSWATWREFTEESLTHKDKMASVVHMWTNRCGHMMMGADVWY